MGLDYKLPGCDYLFYHRFAHGKMSQRVYTLEGLVFGWVRSVALPLCWCGWQRQWSIELRDFPVDKGKQSFSQFSVVPLHLSVVFLLIWTDQRLVLPQSILTPESKILQVSWLNTRPVSPRTRLSILIEWNSENYILVLISNTEWLCTVFIQNLGKIPCDLWFRMVIVSFSMLEIGCGHV